MRFRAVQLRRVRSRPAFTLIELVMACAIVSILMIASVSAIAISGRAIPDGRSRSSAVVIEANLASMLSQDFFGATGATLTSSTDITITVPNRHGGTAQTETLRYYWDTASAGTPVKRQVNNGTAVIVANNVREFAMVYDTTRAGGHYYLTSVRVTVRAGDSYYGRLSTSILVMNQPQVTGT